MEYSTINSTPKQRAADRAYRSPLMIIAGAGSGKTRVLTYADRHLFYAKGGRCLPIFFFDLYNKAAAEMRHRIESLAVLRPRNTWDGNISSSVFAKDPTSGIRPRLFTLSNITIYDADDSNLLIAYHCPKKCDLEWLKSTKQTHAFPDLRRKKSADLLQAYQNDPFSKQMTRGDEVPKNAVISTRNYQDGLFKAGAMGFDDLLFNTNCFRDHLDVLNKYQQRFRYVDGGTWFQDTNLSNTWITKS